MSSENVQKPEDLGLRMDGNQGSARNKGAGTTIRVSSKETLSRRLTLIQKRTPNIFCLIRLQAMNILLVELSSYTHLLRRWREVLPIFMGKKIIPVKKNPSLLLKRNRVLGRY